MWPLAAPLGQTTGPTSSPTSTPVPGVGPGELFEFLPDLVRAAWFFGGALVVVLVGWYVAEPAVRRVVRRRNRENRTIQEAFTRYVRVFFLVVAVFVGAAVAGYGDLVGDSALVVAAGTLAVGVAGQTVIGSLVSGLVLVFDPKFSVGDYIRWGDGEGTVESITLRVTRVRTPDHELVTIPNTTLTSQAVTRPYGHGRARVVERIGIAYEDDVADAITQLEAAAAGVDAVMADPGPEAYVDEFGGDAVLLRVHYWVSRPSTRDLFAVRSAFARAAKTRLDRAGITISPASKRELTGRIDVEDGTGDEPDGASV